MQLIQSALSFPEVGLIAIENEGGEVAAFSIEHGHAQVFPNWWEFCSRYGIDLYEADPDPVVEEEQEDFRERCAAGDPTSLAYAEQ